MTFLDRASPVRSGEELDRAALARYLRAALPGLVGPVEIEQFPSGHSNLTYLVRVGSNEIVLRRPPFGNRVKTAHDMGREYRILSKLSGVYPAPRPLAYCDDESLMGAPFYLMERIPGVILRQAPPAGLTLPPPVTRRLCEAFIDNLARLHQLDFAAIGLADLGRPAGYVERQVSGWSERYRLARTDDIPEVEQIAGWLKARLPEESGAALIHNDYKYDNLVLDADDLTRIRGVLDWEMSTLGDPLMDLGTALGYWVEPGDSDEMKALAFGPTALPGSLTRRELAERYADKTGRAAPDLLFYYCFALFKTAVVVQQIYYRYRQGLTRDQRFGALIAGVRVLSQAAVRSTERGAI
jgi:aminoglycoside phosphotransferase (APT) family kinase protein